MKTAPGARLRTANRQTSGQRTQTNPAGENLRSRGDHYVPPGGIVQTTPQTIDRTAAPPNPCRLCTTPRLRSGANPNRVHAGAGRSHPRFVRYDRQCSVDAFGFAAQTRSPRGAVYQQPGVCGYWRGGHGSSAPTLRPVGPSADPFSLSGCLQRVFLNFLGWGVVIPAEVPAGE